MSETLALWAALTASVTAIVVGITTILIILMASIASLNFGKNSEIRIGAKIIPEIVIKIEIHSTIIFGFLFLIPVDS